MLVFMSMTVTRVWFVVVIMSHDVEETSDDGNTEGAAEDLLRQKNEEKNRQMLKNLPGTTNESLSCYTK